MKNYHYSQWKWIVAAAVLGVALIVLPSRAMAGSCAGDEDCDGVPDASDQCPGYDNALDTDGDGIADCDDNCPWTANPDQADCNNDGFGDVCNQDAQDLGVAVAACEGGETAPAGETGAEYADTGEAAGYDTYAEGDYAATGAEGAYGDEAGMGGVAFDEGGAGPSCGKLTVASMQQSGTGAAATDEYGYDTGAYAADGTYGDDGSGAAYDDTAAAGTEGAAGDVAAGGTAGESGCAGDEDCDGVPDESDQCPGYDNSLDTDGDGIADCDDNCPYKNNPDQTDSDNDGFGDACPEDKAAMGM